MSTSNWFRSSSYVVDLKTNQYLRFIKMPNRQYCVIFRVFQHIMGVPHQRTMPSVFRSQHVSARPPKTTKSSPKFPHRQHWNKQSATTNTSNRFSHFFVQKRISVYLHDFFRSPIFVSWRRSYNLVIVIVSENMSKNGFQRKMLCAPKCWFSVWLLHTSTSSKSRDKTRRCWKQRTSGHRDAAWNTATAICHLPMWCSS